jgi:hypothetical protein
MITTIASTAFLSMADPQAAPILIGDIFGFVLAVPAALFMAFWMSAVKSKWAVVIGAMLGTIIGFLAILAWVGTLINDKPLPDANGVSVFFSSILLCSTTGVVGGILTDLLVGAKNSRDYGRQATHETH